MSCHIRRFGFLSIFVSVLLLFGLFFVVHAQENIPRSVEQIPIAPTTTADDLLDQDEQSEIFSVTPQILPGHPFYFFKNAGRGIRLFFAFNAERRGELELQYANKRLAEIRALAEQGAVDRVTKQLERYKESFTKVNALAKKLDEKNKGGGKELARNIVKTAADHEKTLAKLARRVSPESLSTVQAARTHILEEAGRAAGDLDAPALNLVLEEIANDAGSPFKPLRNLEVLRTIETKVPEPAKLAIERAEKNALQQLAKRIDLLPTEQKKLLGEYIEKSVGDKTLHAKTLDALETSALKAETLSEIKAAREKIAMKVEKKIGNEEKEVSLSIRPTETEEKPAVNLEKKICPRDVAPVCGENGITYTNKCNAEVSGVNIVYEGKCVTEAAKAVEPQKKSEFSTLCTQEKKPVCGTNNLTYLNSCFAKESGIAIKHEGACEAKKAEVPVTCTKENVPVCGVNNLTYLNTCFAKDADVAIQYEGICKSSLVGEPSTQVVGQAQKSEAVSVSCTKENAPVCGVNNLTYLNSCFAKQAKAAIQYSGACKTGTSTSGTEKTETTAKINQAILQKKLFDDREITQTKKDEIEKKPNPLGVKKKRAVLFNPNEFLSGQTKKSKIALDLFPDKTINTTLREVKEKTPSNYVWKGSVDGENKSSVTISVRGNIANGIIRSLSGDYEIRSEGNGAISIREIDPTIFTRHGHDTPRRSGTVTAQATPPQPATIATITNVDVLFAYTAQAYQTYFNERDVVEGTIEAYLEDANSAFEQSGILVRLRSAGTPVEVSYTESGESATDLDRLGNARDGFMDNLHTLRDQRSADIVVLFERGSADDCGRGYVMNRDNWDFFETRAFAIVRFTCLSVHALAHELGHIFGAAHDRENSNFTPYETFGYGFRNNMRRDIMAYPCGQSNCPMWPYFSNPRNTLGVNNNIILGSATEDVARAINNTRVIIAGFRSGSTIPSIDINIGNFLR